MLNETGCCNSTRNPAVRGSISSLYATGEGQTNPPGVNGSIYPGTPGHPSPRLLGAQAVMTMPLVSGQVLQRVCALVRMQPARY
jgi:uncharacterized protein (TIGR03437 family)